MLDDQEVLEFLLPEFSAQEAAWLPFDELVRIAEENAIASREELEALIIAHKIRRNFRVISDADVLGYTQKQFENAYHRLLEGIEPEDKPDEPEDKLDEEEEQVGVEALECYLDKCAKAVLDWVQSLDPDWGYLVQALKEERGFDDKAVLASLAGYVLDNRLHMIVPQNESLQGVHWTMEDQICPVCKSVYQMSYPGQQACLDPECGRIFHRDAVYAYSDDESTE